MRNILVVLIMLFGFSGFSQSELDCSKFKTGKFKYVTDEFERVIIRSASFQKELNLVTGAEVILSIEWTSECEYVLTFVDLKNHPFLSAEDVKEKKIYSEIISVDGDFFTVRSIGGNLNNEIIQFEKIGEMPDDVENHYFSPTY